MAGGSSRVIPAMSLNPPAVFEFSAAPLLLQRLPPPAHLQPQLLSNRPRLQGLGVLQNLFRLLSLCSMYSQGFLWHRLPSLGLPFHPAKSTVLDRSALQVRK